MNHSEQTPVDAPVQDMEGFEDLTVARLLSALGGDRELLIEIIELFLRDAPVMLRALYAAAGSGDAEALARAAHVLKGSAANFGTTPLYDVARDIEHRAFAGELTGLDQRLVQLDRASGAMQRALLRLREEAAA
ncbi:MAG TPA: Hpt domain-containing protein [Polyangiales bacterium]|nr:Hpt domain-containing protein [Polyangiales bacterium]